MNSAAHTAFQTSIDAGVAELVIDRPPVNALNSREWRELANTLDALGQNPEVRVIVITGSGRAFCAGLDFATVMAEPERVNAVFAPDADRGTNLFQEAPWAWRRLAVPVVAAVHEWAWRRGAA